MIKWIFVQSFARWSRLFICWCILHWLSTNRNYQWWNSDESRLWRFGTQTQFLPQKSFNSAKNYKRRKRKDGWEMMKLLRVKAEQILTTGSLPNLSFFFLSCVGSLSLSLSLFLSLLGSFLIYFFFLSFIFLSFFFLFVLGFSFVFSFSIFSSSDVFYFCI